MDLAPTFLELAGATYPAKWKGREIVPLRGRSLVPMITGAAGAVRGPEETLGWEMMNWRAVRMGEWKITRISSPFGSDDWQLFNLARDPGETDDLSDAFPDVFQKLLQQWDVYEQDVGIIYPAAGIPMNF
jgi:arylsulfatase